MFSYTAPFGGIIKIVPSRALSVDEFSNIGLHEKIEDLQYFIEFNDQRAPWSIINQFQAITLAMGAQWGAYQMLDKKREEND
jgi:hypothetical protein